MGKVTINKIDFELSTEDEAKVLVIQELTTAIRHLRVTMMGRIK